MESSNLAGEAVMDQHERHAGVHGVTAIPLIGLLSNHQSTLPHPDGPHRRRTSPHLPLRGLVARSGSYSFDKRGRQLLIFFSANSY
jgi:hypothetical protein